MIDDQESLSAFSVAGRSEVNQDSIYAVQIAEDEYLLAVADGMGGESGGSIASQVAVAALKGASDLDAGIGFKQLFDAVQKELVAKAEADSSLQKMGTTLTVCYIKGFNAYVAHVGDSRIYHLRSDGVVSRTKDQTELQKLLDENVISKARAKNYPRKNVLLSVMSPYREYELQLSEFNLQNNDRVLLLTDGVYSLVKKVELRDLSLKYMRLSEFMDNVKSVIETRDIRDDYSMVAFQL